MEDHVTSKFVKTNKSHRCAFCGQTFPKGTRMRCDVNQYDKFKTLYVCEGCVELSENRIPEIFDDDPITKAKNLRRAEFTKTITGTTQ